MDYLQSLKLKKDILYELLEEFENDDSYFGTQLIKIKAQIEILDELINELEGEE